ncbi:SPFH domain-containing protein [Nonomuraea sp. NPDC050451]|uniref:SPFH domain-containing protein n=1 Tax=Nonomuraea sp. NPDC050451 TaxID=3364364 RepID=UPI0037911131
MQGYRLQVDMNQTLRIPETAAPTLVSEFGGTGNSPLGGVYDDPRPVQRFVERVLGSTVAGYFNGMAMAGTIDEFLRRYAETRTAFAAKVRSALEEWGVEALQTNLGAVEAEDPSSTPCSRRRPTRSCAAGGCTSPTASSRSRSRSTRPGPARSAAA